MEAKEIFRKLAYHSGEQAKYFAMLAAETSINERVEEERAAQNGKDIPNCHCGVPALYQSGKSGDGAPWERYVCAKSPRDPKNCKFKQWID